MTKQKYSSQKALFYDGFGFIIKIFIIEVDISSSVDTPSRLGGWHFLSVTTRFISLAMTLEVFVGIS
jgi:hypothetical protein